MQFSDEILMAYADGESDAGTRHQIEAAMALDHSIVERVAKHRALRANLGAAFNGVLDEPIPSRLLDATGAAPEAVAGAASDAAAAAALATVADLNAVRAAKNRAARPGRWSWPEWTSIAASLLIGILAGRSALQPSESALFAIDEAGIVASGELSAALTDQLGGEPAGAEVWIGLSFRARSGEYCRTFSTDSAAGFACREANVWKVRALSEGAATAASGEYRMAGSELPPAIVAAVDDVRAGEALDQDEEQAAQQRGWKK
jgi:hypothetical protein